MNQIQAHTRGRVPYWFQLYLKGIYGGWKYWIQLWLYLTDMQNDRVHLLRMWTEWQSRKNIKEGLLRLVWNIFRTVRSFMDLLFVPRTFFRYLMAAGVLHITYEIIRNIQKGLFQTLFLFSPTVRKRNALKDQMEKALSFEDWEANGMELDALEGWDKWRENPISSLYLHKRVMVKTQMYKQLIRERNVTELMFYLRAGLLRKHWGLNNPRLYQNSHVGTKRVIEEYMNTIVEAMDLILNARPSTVDEHSEWSIDNKFAFFSETRHAFGRSALMLSGGGSLGMYHAGVIKALAEQNIMPTVVAGSSAGSIVAGIVGVRHDDELIEAFRPGVLTFHFFGTSIDPADQARRMPLLLSKLKDLFSSSNLVDNLYAACYLLQRFNEQHYILDINFLKNAVRANIGDYTFREAYDRTGRIINITVTSSHAADYPQLLNYLTAPNVLVWSASIASCAIPGIFSPVELLAKDKHGNITSYYPEGLKWSDGSLECDLPMERLSELFNVNHFIVSQVNVHYKYISGYSSFGTGKLNDMLSFLKKQMKTYIKNVAQVGFGTKFLRFLRIGWVPLLTQSFEGDITISPNSRIPFFKMLLSILANPTITEYAEICITGERETWQYVSRIRTMCQIEFALEHAVRHLRGERAAEDAENGHMTRVPSFCSTSTNNLMALGKPKDKTPIQQEKKKGNMRRNKSMVIGGAIMNMEALSPHKNGNLTSFHRDG